MVVLNTNTHSVNDYLDLLAGFGSENIIADYTREEGIENIAAKACIDRIFEGSNNLDILPGIIRIKAVDHYFVAMVLLGEVGVSKNSSLLID